MFVVSKQLSWFSHRLPLGSRDTPYYRLATRAIRRSREDCPFLGNGGAAIRQLDGSRRRVAGDGEGVRRGTSGCRWRSSPSSRFLAKSWMKRVRAVGATRSSFLTNINGVGIIMLCTRNAYSRFSPYCWYLE